MNILLTPAAPLRPAAPAATHAATHAATPTAAPATAPSAAVYSLAGLAGLNVVELDRLAGERAWQEALHQLGYPRRYGHTTVWGAL